MSVAAGTKKADGAGETIRVIVHALLIALVIRTFLFQPFNIPSGSMKATLLVGDYLFVSKYSYGYSHYSLPLSQPLFGGRVFGSAPARGDVVVFDGTGSFSPYISGSPWVKDPVKSAGQWLGMDDANPRVVSLARSFSNNQYIRTKVYDDKDAMYSDIVNSKLQGAVIVPNDFTVTLNNGRTAQILVITDGSETNTANYVQSYASGVIYQWLETTGYSKQQVSLIDPQLRIWYNEKLDSHYFILPGSLAVTLSLVGILLTALVVAREWERGTMEALLSTRLSRLHFVAGKYFSYYILGICSLWFNMCFLFNNSNSIFS